MRGLQDVREAEDGVEKPRRTGSPSRSPKSISLLGCERRLNRLAAGRVVAAAGAAVIAGLRRHVVRGRAHLTHCAFRGVADAFNAALNPVAVLLVGFTRRSGQVIGAIGKIVAGLFAAHWREE